MAVFETAKMWDSYPGILVLLVWVAWGLTSFGCESEFRYAVRVHLFGIACVVRVLKICQLALRQGMHDFLDSKNVCWYLLRLRCSIWR